MLLCAHVKEKGVRFFVPFAVAVVNELRSSLKFIWDFIIRANSEVEIYLVLQEKFPFEERNGRRFRRVYYFFKI